jgi:hypothetical protein
MELILNLDFHHTFRIHLHLSTDYGLLSGMVGGPVTSVETVGVDPAVGGLVNVVGTGVSLSLQVST